LTAADRLCSHLKLPETQAVGSGELFGGRDHFAFAKCRVMPCFFMEVVLFKLLTYNYLTCSPAW